ncbi:hypothetical protein BC941DRAFT_517793 [Chlamydoabsidia padenii]|nr:hypothetical protein BC941DRAFT_517793 [Chlamydoabsidia padenii]
MDHDVQCLWVLYGVSSFVMVVLSSLIVVSGVLWSLFVSGTKLVSMYCYLPTMFIVTCGV